MECLHFILIQSVMLVPIRGCGTRHRGLFSLKKCERDGAKSCPTVEKEPK
jgi:hypothetical protein